MQGAERFCLDGRDSIRQILVCNPRSGDATFHACAAVPSVHDIMKKDFIPIESLATRAC